MKLLTNYFPTLLIALVVLVSACGGGSSGSVDPEPSESDEIAKLQKAIATDWTISSAKKGSAEAGKAEDNVVTIASDGKITVAGDTNTDVFKVLNGKTLKVTSADGAATLDGKAGTNKVTETQITLGFSSDAAGVIARGLEGTWEIVLAKK